MPSQGAVLFCTEALENLTQLLTICSMLSKKLKIGQCQIEYIYQWTTNSHRSSHTYSVFYKYIQHEEHAYLLTKEDYTSENFRTLFCVWHWNTGPQFQISNQLSLLSIWITYLKFWVSYATLDTKKHSKNLQERMLCHIQHGDTGSQFKLSAQFYFLSILIILTM